MDSNASEELSYPIFSFFVHIYSTSYGFIRINETFQSRIAKKLYEMGYSVYSIIEAYGRKPCNSPKPNRLGSMAKLTFRVRTAGQEQLEASVKTPVFRNPKEDLETMNQRSFFQGLEAAVKLIWTTSCKTRTRVRSIHIDHRIIWIASTLFASRAQRS